MFSTVVLLALVLRWHHLDSFGILVATPLPCLNEPMRSISSLILVVFFAVGCGSKTASHTNIIHNPDIPEGNEKALENIQAEVVATFGGDTENLDAVLSGWMGLTVAPNGQIYVIDYQVNQLKAFDHEGSFLWSKLQEGEGPGELRNARTPRVGPDNRLYISNQGATRMDIFNLEGELLESFQYEPIGLTHHSFHGILQDTMAVFYKWKRGVRGGSFSIRNMLRDWSVVDSFSVVHEMPETPNPLLISWQPASIVDDEIVLPNQWEFETKVVDHHGNPIQLIQRDKTGLSGTIIHEMEGGYGQVQFSSHGAPMILDGEWRISLSSWTLNLEEMVAALGQPRDENSPRPDWGSSLDIYDREWTLAYSLNDDQQEELFSGNILTTDGNGHVYTYDSETGMGYKYRVSVRR